MKTVLLSLTALAASSVAIPSALAEPSNGLTVTGQRAASNDPDAIRIPYADLDLSAPAQRDVLSHRVAVAIRRGCGSLYEGGDLTQGWQCQNIAWRVARPQLEAATRPVLAANAGRQTAIVLRFASR